MNRFEVNSERNGKFWVRSLITGKVYLVELLTLATRSTGKSPFTRILHRSWQTAEHVDGMIGAIRLEAGVNPLPFLAELDQMAEK